MAASTSGIIVRKKSILKSASRKMVLNLYNYFTQEKDNNAPLLPVNAVIERVANALQIGTATVKRIVGRSRKTNEEPVSPRKRTQTEKSRRQKSYVDDFAKEAIRRIIYDMYTKREHITLDTLLERILQQEVCKISRTALRFTMFQLGFQYRKDDNRRGLCEIDSVIVKRINFVRQYMENKNHEQLPLVFIDETWIFSKGSDRRSWQDDTPHTVKKLTNVGRRYIVLSAGGENGFIPGTHLIFASNSNVGDYHGEMNAETFEHWLEHSLLKNLEEPSLIILDNAPYHSRLKEKSPNSLWNKQSLKEFLTKHNVPFQETDFKTELLFKAKNVHVEKKYCVDEIINLNGHQVLRLPPYHCHYNAIEMVWSQAKRYYDAHIGRTSGKAEEVISTWHEALNNVTVQNWSNYVKHVDSIISAQWQEEMQLDISENQQPVVIHLDESDTEDEDLS